MQPVYLLLFLFTGFCGFSQLENDTLVQKNKLKIEALMKELNNLEKKEKSISKGTDDCEKQTMLLSSQIIELQEQLKNNQTEVQRLTTLLSDLMNKDHSSGADGNNPESSKNAENGKTSAERINNSCYVVLKSFRKQHDVDQWVKKNNLIGVSVKNNLKKTWFHAVMEQQVSISEVGKIVYKQRKNGFADAWWKEKGYFE